MNTRISFPCISQPNTIFKIPTSKKFSEAYFEPCQTSMIELFCENSYRLLNVKVGFSPSKKVVFIHFNEIPLKMMKKTLYLILKALFVREIFSFFSWLFDDIEKRLDKKV